MATILNGDGIREIPSFYVGKRQIAHSKKVAKALNQPNSLPDEEGDYPRRYQVATPESVIKSAVAEAIRAAVRPTFSSYFISQILKKRPPAPVPATQPSSQVPQAQFVVYLTRDFVKFPELSRVEAASVGSL